MRDRFRLWEPIEVRWSDMDAMGHVNNATYFTYFEAARLRYFETVGLWTMGGGPKEGPALVSATANFRAQVHYPASLEVGARVARIGSKSFTFEHAIVRKGSDEIVADGQTVTAWVDYGAGKAIPVPDALREAIARLEGRDDL